MRPNSEYCSYCSGNQECLGGGCELCNQDIPQHVKQFFREMYDEKGTEGKQQDQQGSQLRQPTPFQADQA